MKTRLDLEGDENFVVFGVCGKEKAATGEERTRRWQDEKVGRKYLHKKDHFSVRLAVFSSSRPLYFGPLPSPPRGSERTEIEIKSDLEGE